MAFFKRSAKPDYLTEFNETYSWLVEHGPSTPAEVSDWGSSVPTFGAKAFAAQWRKVELEDAEEDPRSPNPHYFRVIEYRAAPIGRIGADPDAKKVYVQLGEQLYDAGALNPPYDENLPDDPDNLHGSSPGRSRLYALMYLSIYATELGHPRAAQWTSQAREGLAGTPNAEPPYGLAEWWSRIA